MPAGEGCVEEGASCVGAGADETRESAGGAGETVRSPEGGGGWGTQDLRAAATANNSPHSGQLHSYPSRHTNFIYIVLPIIFTF